MGALYNAGGTMHEEGIMEGRTDACVHNGRKGVIHEDELWKMHDEDA